MGREDLGACRAATDTAPGSWATPAPIRAAFFDVDGTMLSHALGTEPASTREAVSRLVAAGVTPILATGRTSYLLDLVDLTDFGGFVTFNGQLVEVGGRTIHSNPMDPADVAVAVRQSLEGRYACLFMEREGMYVNRIDRRVRDLAELAHNHYETDDVRRALTHDVYQLNLFVGPGDERLLLDECRHSKATRWCDIFCDVMPDAGGKDAGVRLVMEELGLDPRECAAFGDGGNDVDMFGVVGTSVAMGNGNPEARAAATYVTDHVDDDGIWNACVRLGLIDAPLWAE